MWLWKLKRPDIDVLFKNEFTTIDLFKKIKNIDHKNEFGNNLFSCSLIKLVNSCYNMNIWVEEVNMTKYDIELSMKAKTRTEKDNRLVEPVPDISSV